MNRYRTYAPKDETPLFQDAGDPGFVGIQRRLDPGQLEPGRAWEAVNKRFTDRCAATRSGIRKMGWTNRSNPSTDPSTAGLVIPFGVVHGAGTFSDPTTGQEWVVVAADGGVYLIHENTTSVQINLPTGVTLSGRVTFVQANNQLYLFRGESLPWLMMDDLDIGFTDPTVTLVPGNIETPPAERAIYFQNRLFVPYSRDLVFMSDILQCEQGMDTITTMRINKGSADKLVALYKFNDTTLICAKENSIYVLWNVQGINSDIANLAVLDTVTTEYGCTAPRSFVQVGSDVWFLAHNRGIMSIAQTQQNKLHGVDVPSSYDIQPIIDRINWQYASNACAANWNNKVYFAVPLDDATKKFTAITPTLSAPGVYLFSGLIVGRDYYYEAGLNGAGLKDVTLVNGSQTFTPALTGSETYGKWFTATATTAVITVSSGTAPGTIQPGLRGYNNAVLVYDLLNQAWAGYDTGEFTDSVSLAVREFVKLHYAGDIRLFFVSDDGFLNLYEDGFFDMTGTTAGLITERSIADKLVTRGYGGALPGRKRFRDVAVQIGTWWPSYTVDALVDGVEESQDLTPTAVTRSRTEYWYPFNAQAYSVSNSGDNYLTEGRKDYSLSLPTLSSDTVDFKSGVDLDRHQEARDPYRVHGRGRFLQLKIESTQGRNVIRGVDINLHAGERTYNARA